MKKTLLIGVTSLVVIFSLVFVAQALQTFKEDVKFDGKLTVAKKAVFEGFVDLSQAELKGIYSATKTRELLAKKSDKGHNHIGENWTASTSKGSVLKIMQEGSAIGLTTSGNNGTALFTTSTNGTALFAASTNGTALFATSTKGTALDISGKIKLNGPVGSGSIPIDSINVDISNANVTSNSSILLTVADASSNDRGGIRISSIAPGVGFTVSTMDGISTGGETILFNYLIIN